MANLKNITDLPVAESAEGLNLIVNDNGAAKQIAASAVGVKSYNDLEDKPCYTEVDNEGNETIHKLDAKYMPTPIILYIGPDPKGASTGNFLYKDAGLTQPMYYDEFMQRFENGEKLFVKATHVEDEVDETVIASAVAYRHSLYDETATVTFAFSSELETFFLSFK